MYLPTFMVSSLSVALTWLCTLNPVWRQRRIFLTRGRPISFSRSSREKTSWVKISWITSSWKRQTRWKAPSGVVPPSVINTWIWGWKLMRSPKVWITVTTPGMSSRPVAVCKDFTSIRSAQKQRSLRSFRLKRKKDAGKLHVRFERRTEVSPAGRLLRPDRGVNGVMPIESQEFGTLEGVSSKAQRDE